MVTCLESDFHERSHKRYPHYWFYSSVQVQPVLQIPAVAEYVFPYAADGGIQGIPLKVHSQIGEYDPLQHILFHQSTQTAPGYITGFQP